MTVSHETEMVAEPMCHCGRDSRRPGQRNCKFCNREANKRNRDKAALKRQQKAQEVAA